MKRFAIDRVVRAAVIAAVLTAGTAVAAEAPARIGGTFLQLWDEHQQWSDADWENLFDSLQTVGIQDLVVQWVTRAGAAYYAREGAEPEKRAVLDAILEQADRRGLHVWVGLSDDPEYWRKIRRDPGLLEVYFKRRELASAEVLGAVAPRVLTHGSFAGWYVADEVDDVHWLDAQRRQTLTRYLADLGARVRAVAPGTKVALSGFSNANADPRALQELWTALLTAAPIDLVLFQDGVGAGKLMLDDLPPFLDAARTAARESSRSLRVVVEVFRQTGGEPITDQHFSADPAPLARIQSQLAIAGHYSDGSPVAFSVPEYMTPRGGDKAQVLFDEYRKSIGR